MFERRSSIFNSRRNGFGSHLVQEGADQTMYLDVDIRMSNTWSKTGKSAVVAPFEITYQVDGSGINRVLHGSETSQRIQKESVWQEVVAGRHEGEEDENEQVPIEQQVVQQPSKLGEKQPMQEMKEKNRDVRQQKVESIGSIHGGPDADDRGSPDRTANARGAESVCSY